MAKGQDQYNNDIFFALKETDTCKFADSITPYIYNSNLKSAQETLEKNSELAIFLGLEWIALNLIPINVMSYYQEIKADKCGQN